MTIRLITDDLLIHYFESGNKRTDKSSIIKTKTDNLLIHFCLESLNKDIYTSLISDAIKQGFTVISIIDKLPNKPLLLDNLIYIETGFRWYIHTLFFSPTIFKGILSNKLPVNSSLTRMERAFSSFTKYTISTLKNIKEIEDIKHNITSNKILYEIKGGLGDVIMSLVLFKHMDSIGTTVDILTIEPYKELLLNQDYINAVYTDKSLITTSSYSSIVQLDFGTILNDYRLDLNKQNRILSILQLNHINPTDVSSLVPDIKIPDEYIAHFKKDYYSYKNKIFIGTDSNRVDARLPEDISNNILSILNKDNYTTFTSAKKQNTLNAKFNLSGKLTVLELIALISIMDYVLTVDSSFLHIAGALGIPTVCMFTFFPTSWRCSLYSSVKTVTPNTSCYPCIGGAYTAKQSCLTHSCYSYMNIKEVLDTLSSFKKDNNIKYIGIESNDGIGDILMLTPTLEFYNSKGYKVIFATNKSHDIVKNLPFIHRTVSSLKDFKKPLDIILRTSGLLSDYSIKNNTKNRIYSSANMCRVKEEDLNYHRPIINLLDSEISSARKLIKTNGKPLLVVALDSEGSLRGYPDYKQNDLINILSNKYNVVLVSSKTKKSTLVNNLTGKLSLRELFSIIYLSDIILTVDTGILHIAGAFNKKILGLFGPICGSWRCSTYSNSIYIQAKTPCSPCADGQWVRQCDKYCKLNNHGCLDTININEILQKLNFLLLHPINP